MLSQNKIKYIRSLRIKKFRDQHKKFVVEGDKIILDIIRKGSIPIPELIATDDWLKRNLFKPSEQVLHVIPVDERSYKKITSLENPTGVMAIMNKPLKQENGFEMIEGVSLILDDIQDPGNIGTIIRTASWFGISRIYCSLSCADCYGPKVVQASMGAILNADILYLDLHDLLLRNSRENNLTVYGTFTTGINIWSEKPEQNALIVFGNESHGISDDLLPFISVKLSIPSGNATGHFMESLNVASAAAIVCAAFYR